MQLTAAPVLLFIGGLQPAIGEAFFRFIVWLPDAMVGPTRSAS